MTDNQTPGKLPSAGTTPAKRGRCRGSTLAIAVCLALAGTTIWLPVASASAGQVRQAAHARIADPAQSLVWGRSRSHAAQFGSFGSALVGSTPVQPGPSAVAVDLATNTIYIANGNNANGPTNPGGDTVSVIDGRHCSALDISRC